MPKTIHIKSISQFRQLAGLTKPKHPKVSIDYGLGWQNMSDLIGKKIASDLYFIVFKSGNCGHLMYGRNSYDFEGGTLLFFAPGQIMQYDGNPEQDFDHKEEWRLAFHPDLIRASELSNQINSYSFFNYDTHEGLHVSEDEKHTIEEILSKILKEYNQHIDKHSQRIIIANIHLILDYCLRFYDRQFYTRTNLNSDILSKFERLLNTYYGTDKVQEFGIPTVNFCASELNLSTNYFSDLLRKETGKSAQEHIHSFIIDKAKNRLLNSSNKVSEIGYSLGFEYPSNFSNLFKAKTGLSPKEFRNSS